MGECFRIGFVTIFATRISTSQVLIIGNGFPGMRVTCPAQSSKDHIMLGYLRPALSLSLLITYWSAVCCSDENKSGPPVPVTQAHAHNDYLHERPLLEAIENGFTSIEADVFPVEGELLVAHSVLEISKQKTLEGLYLRPLSELARKNSGSVYGDGRSVMLLVDIKTNGKDAYDLLTKQLASYADVVSHTEGDTFVEKAVTVVISGDRPISDIAASNPRFAGIDGRLGDLDSDMPVSLLPLISDNWGNHFKYRGKGEMADSEKAKLVEIVTKAHIKGRRLRFWATPESRELWQELRNAGVDFIGTDDLLKLSKFLRE